MSETLLASYEEIPYPSTPRFQTHPDTMATAATLLGLTPPPVGRCSVLELGCATGGNLLPMAQGLPESRFVGIDFSPRQVELGNAVIRALGFPNISLQARSILDIEPSFGQFDYIICHGVWSWVAPEVQNKILSICSANLSPNGIAYVSYNTYPGWHTRAMVREMLVYRVAGISDPMQRVREARSFLDLLVQATHSPTSTYAACLKEELELLSESDDSYLFHEHLEEVNRPVYFHEFAGYAAAHDLQYLGEAGLASSAAGRCPPQIETALRKMPRDLISQEQYLDFLRARTFRRSLLCHATQRVRRPASTDLLAHMHLESLVRPVAAKPDPYSALPEEFASHNGQSLTSSNPLIKTALMVLQDAWPQSIHCDELIEQVRSRLTGRPGIELDFDVDRILPAMMNCYLANLIDAHVHPARFTTQISARPMAAPLPRLQASDGLTAVSNLRHRTVNLEEFDRLVVRHLDGTHTHDELRGLLEQAVASDELEIEHEGKPLADPAMIRKAVEQSIPQALYRIARSALLIG